jgi:predicted RNA binding protein YcfA (HicA-like mRNA interferase family)
MQNVQKDGEVLVQIRPSSWSVWTRRMVAMKFRDVLRLLEDDGWQLVAHRGSHGQYKHPTKPGKVTVAGKSGADVPKGTAANILRQAGLRGPRQ